MAKYPTPPPLSDELVVQVDGRFASVPKPMPVVPLKGLVVDDWAEAEAAL